MQCKVRGCHGLRAGDLSDYCEDRELIILIRGTKADVRVKIDTCIVVNCDENNLNQRGRPFCIERKTICLPYLPYTEINQTTYAQSRIVQNRSVNSAVNLKMSAAIVSTTFESAIYSQSLNSTCRLYPTLSGGIMLSGFYTCNPILQLA